MGRGACQVSLSPGCGGSQLILDQSQHFGQSAISAPFRHQPNIIMKATNSSTQRSGKIYIAQSRLSSAWALVCVHVSESLNEVKTRFHLWVSNKVWGHAKRDSKEMCSVIATSRWAITWGLSNYTQTLQGLQILQHMWESKGLENIDLGTVQHREDADWGDREKGTRVILKDSNSFCNQEGWCSTAIPKFLGKTNTSHPGIKPQLLPDSCYCHWDIKAEDYRRVKLPFQKQNSTISQHFKSQMQGERQAKSWKPTLNGNFRDLRKSLLSSCPSQVLGSAVLARCFRVQL